jgi:hypothetical protein
MNVVTHNVIYWGGRDQVLERYPSLREWHSAQLKRVMSSHSWLKAGDVKCVFGSKTTVTSAHKIDNRSYLEGSSSCDVAGASTICNG